MSIDSVLSRVSAIQSLMSSLGGQVAGGYLGASALGATGVARSDGSATSSSVASTSTATSEQFAQALAAAGLTGTTGVQDAASPTSTGPTAQSLVSAAEKYRGVPYVWGGESRSGMDCSGLVQRALADLGVDAPRTAREQMTIGTSVASLDEALPGDLVVFDGGSHIGIYVGDNRMIHAPRPGKVVQEADVYEKPTAIRRVLPQAAAAATSQSAVATALMSALTTVGATNGTPSTSVATSTEALTSSVASADVQRLALQMLTGSAA
ncbi:cell wall-associated NlpC family hydrolase [Flavimobilis soli]|uniref:Cell wall-associated NlpC family hydrolase n=1 Tax=Flavimobilis soli TaxID=442709 RepID=A0A2A9EGS0_9MICO|nr:C40 family peptidase [Flavimobilis soli]PFG37420.1 cell wall-associated NlpC family hydrolase [Flavimobilis soli]